MLVAASGDENVSKVVQIIDELIEVIFSAILVFRTSIKGWTLRRRIETSIILALKGKI